MGVVMDLGFTRSLITGPARESSRWTTSYAAVRSLPGIGRYTAGAILSIGLDTRLPILEANTIRVLSRLTAFRGDPASTAGQKHLWSIAEAILPAKRVGAFNQSLMELGSEICTPKSPACDCCPVASLCEARRRELVGEIPRPAKRTKYEEVTEAAVVIRNRGRVLLRHCQPGERWAGLWDFPRFAISSNNGQRTDEIVQRTQALVGLQVVQPTQLATLTHGVTRFRITLHCYEAKLKSRVRTAEAAHGDDRVRWVAVEELTHYPLSVTGRKISDLVAEQATPQKIPASAVRRRRSRHS
jgi:A/G-specific adenine glycosylase